MVIGSASLFGAFVYFLVYIMISCPRETKIPMIDLTTMSTMHAMEGYVFEGTWIDKAKNYNQLMTNTFKNNEGKISIICLILP